MKSIIDQAVDRFLGWKLPADFAPDAGISFVREANPNSPVELRFNHEPVGTNLFTADQAKAMFEYVLQGLLAQPTDTNMPDTERCIQNLAVALVESKGWMRSYADAIIRDAIDRKHLLAQPEQTPVAYRAWFDKDNGARWLFTLWPEEERLDVAWESLFTHPPAPKLVTAEDVSEAVVDAYITFMEKASYLSHPDVPYLGTVNNDSPEKWKRRFIKAALTHTYNSITLEASK